MTTHTFTVVAPDSFINANERLHWREAARRTKSWREAAGWIGLRDRVRFPAAHIVAELHFRGNRQRDAANWYPTVKACIDGIVGDAQVMPNDSDKHVLSPSFAPSQTGTGFVGVKLTFTTELPAIRSGESNNHPGSARTLGLAVGLVEGRGATTEAAATLGGSPGTGAT